MWYHVLDFILYAIHVPITVFNLIGWIWQSTRRAHLYVVALTAFSWLVPGIWYGFGYCFLTDWHWDVKAALGKYDLPNSFIKHVLDEITGIDSNPTWIDAITAVSFIAVTLLAIYFNFVQTDKRPSK